MNVLLGIMWCKNKTILLVSDREQLGKELFVVTDLVQTALMFCLACLIHLVVPKTRVSRGPWECGRVASRPLLEIFLTNFLGPVTANLLLLIRNSIEFTCVQL